MGARHVLNALAVAQRAVRVDVEIAQREFEMALEGGEKSTPVLAVRIPADLVPWRSDIEDEQALAGHVYSRDCVEVLGDGGCGEAVFQGLDLRLRLWDARIRMTKCQSRQTQAQWKVQNEVS
jgi:hypothetical protein